MNIRKPVANFQDGKKKVPKGTSQIFGVAHSITGPEL
jgi:hypothetical protein